jgi:hypothetical protein
MVTNFRTKKGGSQDPPKKSTDNPSVVLPDIKSGFGIDAVKAPLKTRCARRTGQALEPAGGFSLRDKEER